MKQTMLAILAAMMLSASLGADRDPRLPPSSAPGATNPAITAATLAKTLCNPKWSTKSIRPTSAYTTKLKKQQMAALGYTVPNPLPRVKTASGKGTRADLSKCVARSASAECYEEDHLISLELGGHPTDPRNLWPQSWTGPINAHDKDRLENKLHERVCDGTISLQDAQTAISRDWIAAYRRFVK